jgi:integrase
MAAPLIKTKTPGIFKRGSRYAVIFYVAGKQKKESARTYDEARRLKASRQAAVASGEFHEDSRIKLLDYLGEWIERYQGTGRRGFRENTRDEYRRLMAAYAFEFFSERVKLAEITPRQVSKFVQWLCEQPSRKGGTLSDSAVRNALNPLRAAFSTATSEGLIRSNPCAGVSLPHRPTAEETEEEDVRPLSREQLRLFLAVVPARYRLLFKFLASTGLRLSEVRAIRWRHLRLDGSEPCVMVRQGFVRGRLQPPKSKYGKRDVPLSPALVSELRHMKAEAEWSGPDHLVFPNQAGSIFDGDNLRRRVIKPTAEEIGAPWAGFHTFRHTCASLLFARGANAVQVQRWLGHHSPAFTLERYVHLLSGDQAEALDLEAEIRPSNSPSAVAIEVATEATRMEPTPLQAAA